MSTMIFCTQMMPFDDDDEHHHGDPFRVEWCVSTLVKDVPEEFRIVREVRSGQHQVAQLPVTWRPGWPMALR